MDTTPALLLLFTVTGMTYALPVCPVGCRHTNSTLHTLHFSHVLELQTQSVAPWELKENTETARWPVNIMEAKCKNCTIDHMVAKPIHLQIYVYRTVRNTVNNSLIYCKCPFNLAVGCTCVREERG